MTFFFWLRYTIKPKGKMKKLLLLAIISVAIFSSCKKNKTSATPETIDGYWAGNYTIDNRSSYIGEAKGNTMSGTWAHCQVIATAVSGL